jgi:hypothetical protein
MKTYSAKPSEVEKKWHVVDAEGVVLGRMAAEIAKIIRGKQQDDGDKVYLHRGIAARQFQRSFVLAQGIEVAGAALDNGLLHIELARPASEPDVRTVQIDVQIGGPSAPTIEGRVARPRARLEDE